MAADEEAVRPRGKRRGSGNRRSAQHEAATLEKLRFVFFLIP